MRVKDLTVALGLDWGNSSPGYVVWGAALPDGHVHLFDELKFQRMSAKDVADAVKAKCREWRLPEVPPCACDPSLLPAKKGERGEWIGLTLQRHGVPVFRVSNDRVNGWQRVHEALAIDPATGTPWLTLHPRCRYAARTLPLMVQATDNPEDLDTAADDHPPDGIRYLLMGGLLRPGTVTRSVSRPAANTWAWWKQWHAQHDRAGLFA